ncbi:hypothetical protein PWT90_07808 [Aphanocladium album]|nr:hypothetical protein PWT90_07808 [Aphanocladium album]
MYATLQAPSVSVERRVATLLKRLPQGDEDWQSRVSSPSRLAIHSSMLLLHRATPETTIKDLFHMYVELMQKIKAMPQQEAVMDLLKTLVLGTGLVLLQDRRSRQSEIQSLDENATLVCEGVRRCFQSAGSTAALEDKRLLEYMASAGRAIDAIHRLKVLWTPRADELPLHGPFLFLASTGTWCMLVPVLSVLVNIFPTVLCCQSRDAVPYIVTMISRNAHKPKNEWDSSSISIPQLIYRNLGARFR